jgi:hypothetical protein
MPFLPLLFFVLPLVPVSLQDYQDVLESIPCGFNASASSSFMEVRSTLRFSPLAIC